MNIEHVLPEAENRNAQSGLASWEEPYLPFVQRIQKHWRHMLVHLWGPAGSVVFHVAAVGTLLVLTPETREEIKSVIVEIPIIHTVEPIDPPSQIQTPPDVKPPDPVEKFNPSEEQPNPSFEMTNTSDPKGSNGTTNEGDGPGTSLIAHLNTGMEINTAVKSILILKDWNTGPSGVGRVGRKQKYVASNPAAKLNEPFVERSLRWLKREQQADGSWLGSKQNVRPAMTSMALLAFLAHSETPDSREFGTTVQRGIEWLLANQESDGHFKGRDAHDYVQPIAAYALCEAYTMIGQPQLKEAAIKAVSQVVQGQHASGGFNYNLDQSLRNDSSYMAWCCQALKAAKAAKLQNDVPGLESSIKKAIAGFRFNADPNGGFGYETGGRSGLSGAGTLCMQLLGAPNTPEVENTLKFLEPCTFSFATPDQQPYSGGSPIYYWYYITQAKFNHGKDTFTPWDKQFSPELRRTQVVEKNAIEGPDGKPADVGHWESPAKGEHTGGVVQDTALCTLMLEVYYRYLSTSQHLEVDSEVLASISKPDDSITVRVR